MIICVRDIKYMKVNQKDLSDLFKEHQQDVQTIEGGFRSKYMTWAKVASIMNKECPGWSHHCRMNPSDGHPLFDAPDGSMYFVFYFKDPENNEYGDFIYPIMAKNKQMALKRNQIHAREISIINVEVMLHIVVINLDCSISYGAKKK